METKFKYGSFIDYKGVEHKFTVAGVVIRICQEDEVYIESSNWDRIFIPTSIEKILSVGISICNPGSETTKGDEYNRFRGEKQAQGRAIKLRDDTAVRVVAVTKSGMLNDKVVDAILEDTVENIKNNPGQFIKGYNAAEKKWRSIGK